MSNPKELMKELLQRLSADKSPSRDRDAEIFISVTPGVLEAGRIDRLGGLVGWWPRDAPYQSAREVPQYTVSIDAALLLIPEWHRWRVGCGRRVQYIASVEPTVADHGISVGETDSTPAIALCIAALKAREAANG